MLSAYERSERRRGDRDCYTFRVIAIEDSTARKHYLLHAFFLFFISTQRNLFHFEYIRTSQNIQAPNWIELNYLISQSHRWCMHYSLSPFLQLLSLSLLHRHEHSLLDVNTRRIESFQIQLLTYLKYHIRTLNVKPLDGIPIHPSG